MHDQTLADDYFKTAEFCSSAARSSAPMHNFKDINWDELQAVVAQRKRERTLAAGWVRASDWVRRLQVIRGARRQNAVAPPTRRAGALGAASQSRCPSATLLLRHAFDRAAPQQARPGRHSSEGIR